MTSASAIVDLAALPTAQSITLLLKNQKSTTLVSVEPTSTFDDIKTLLLAALQSRHVPDVPDSPATLELGVLADRRDASKGWIPIQQRAQDLAAAKNAKKAVTGKKNMSPDSVESVGLVDGSWMAWRIRKASEKEDGWTKVDEDSEVMVDVDEEEDPGWDVVIPKYDDDEEG